MSECERCEDWRRLGLSGTCPDCDALYLAMHCGKCCVCNVDIDPTEMMCLKCEKGALNE